MEYAEDMFVNYKEKKPNNVFPKSLTKEIALTILEKDIKQFQHLPQHYLEDNSFWLAMKERKLYPSLFRINNFENIDIFFVAREFNLEYYLPYIEERVSKVFDLSDNKFYQLFYFNITFNSNFLQSLEEDILLELVKQNPFTLLKLKEQKENFKLTMMAFYHFPDILLFLSETYRFNFKLIEKTLNQPSFVKQLFLTNKESYFKGLMRDHLKFHVNSNISLFKYKDDKTLFDLALESGDIYVINYIHEQQKYNFIEKHIHNYPQLTSMLTVNKYFTLLSIKKLVMLNQDSLQFLTEDLKKHFDTPEKLNKIKQELEMIEKNKVLLSNFTDIDIIAKELGIEYNKTETAENSLSSI